MELYQIDAFTDKKFSGNPAAVVPLDKWPDDSILQQIAMENNLSDTAFFIPQDTGFHLRWFTPAVEINLCGHATLATAYVLFNILGYKNPSIRFSTLSGDLMVTVKGDLLCMDFPSWVPKPVPTLPPLLEHAIPSMIKSVLKYRDYLVELTDEEAVRLLQPDIQKLFSLGTHVIVTAEGTTCDFVSRFFAPSAGIEEDPVTGSAHSQLTPFWSERLNKKNLFARQLSKRGGELWCEQNGERVQISGKCAFYLKGEIIL